MYFSFANRRENCNDANAYLLIRSVCTRRKRYDIMSSWRHKRPCNSNFIIIISYGVWAGGVTRPCVDRHSFPYVGDRLRKSRKRTVHYVDIISWPFRPISEEKLFIRSGGVFLGVFRTVWKSQGQFRLLQMRFGRVDSVAVRLCL